MNDWQPSQSALEDAVTMTPVMRSSSKPQWREVRERLLSAGVQEDDAVLTLWVTEGDANMGATIATRAGRVFDVMIVMGYDRDDQRVSRDEGFVTSFREVASEDIAATSTGRPNSWLQAAEIARLILEKEP